MCRSICELVLAVIIILFSVWQTAVSQWILLATGILLLIHSFVCPFGRCFTSISARKRR